VVRKRGAAEASGRAEELFWRFPKQLNSSAALRLAGAEEVEVELRGDAPEGVIIHDIYLEHAHGRAHIHIENKARGTSSVTAAYSLYATLKSAVKLVKKRGRVIVGTFAVL